MNASKHLQPANRAHPIISEENATWNCVAMAAPAEIPDVDREFMSISNPLLINIGNIVYTT